MKTNKHQLISAAKELSAVIVAIEKLLKHYKGVSGNENYIKYCFDAVSRFKTKHSILDQIIDDTYNVDMNKRKGINIAVLMRIINEQFKILDDIDTAGDMFKPKWCPISRVIEQLHRLRWLHCTVESNSDSEGEMVVNGVCYRPESRVVLSFN